VAGRPKRRARLEAEQSRALTVIPQPEPEPEPSDRFGRPIHGKYRPEFVDQARVLCEEGMTDKELARFFDVSRSTLYEWQFAHPEFAEAMKLGKAPANDRLERRAYEVAMGYTATVREAIKVRDGGKEVVQLVEREVEIPPNPDMLRWLLKNRRPDIWRDKTESVSTSVEIVLTADQARERLKARLDQLKQLGTGQSEAS
jgi:transposase